MKRQSHRDWRQAATALRAELAAEPGNLELARRVWELLAGSTGFDVRNGRRLVETFGFVAMRSEEGLAALVSAFRKLADDTGEYPRAALFDPPLENLLRLHVRQTDHPLHQDIEWILECIASDT